MQKMKGVCALLLAAVLLIGGCVPAYAAQQALGQLQLSLTTNKQAYGELEQITATLEIANNSKTDIYDIDLAHQPLEGYYLAPGAKDMLHIGKLGAGETKRSEVTYVHENGVLETLPQTGDHSAVSVWGVLLVVSLALVVALGLRYRSVQRVLALVLCVGCLLSCVSIEPMRAAAEDDDEDDVVLLPDSVLLTERVKVADGHKEISACIALRETSLKDSDGDGLYDYIENIVGSSNAKADSDGDGLTDVQEVLELHTDPTKADSDGNGVSDAQEDTDGDGLKNGYEYANGLDPILKDTDFDGLTDEEELNTYGTNPRKADSDGDGANDGLEVAYGTDPCKANASFTQTVASEPVSENNPVAVEVSANVSGRLLGTVTVAKADYVNHPFATANIAGALGAAYEFTAGGAINGAQVTFKYDTSLGTIGDKFQPRIYYVNEETQELEELPNQTVKNGEVSVSIDHFSCYILLNKVEFDAIWELEIKPPEYASDKTGIDVVFVIDSSGSMSNNDGKGLRKTAAKNFVAKLGENDRGAVVDFDSTAHIYQGFTSEHVLLNSAIDRIGSSGGTNLSNGMKAGIGLFTDANYTRTDAYKYIIFLTDGNGSYSDTYTTQAAKNDIVVYTIGLGSDVKENVLRLIAEGTNGKYFFASDAKDLPLIYDDVADETVGFTTDLNGDGINDYYNRMIYEGKLVLSNGSYQFVGDDFNYDLNGNLSDDFDGDGLKNGEELIITQVGDKVYMKMISNPLLSDSDYDGVGDKEELDQKSDPFRHSYNRHAVDFLRENENFWGYELAKDYDNKTSVRVAVDMVDALTFNWDVVKDCKQVYMDYFYDYGQKAVESATQANEMETAIEWTAALTENTKNGIKYILAGKIYIADNPMEVLNELFKLRKELFEVGKQLAQAAADPNRYYEMRDLFVKLTKIDGQLEKFGFLHTKLSLKVTDFANKYQNLMDKKNLTGMKNSTTITVVGSVLITGLNVANTINNYAKLRANEAAFAENLDILAYMAVNANRPMARKAANQLYELVESEFLDFGKQRASAVATDIALGGTELAVALLVSTNPYTKAAKLVIDLADLLLGFSHKAQSINNALALESLTTVMRYLCVRQLTAKAATYECASSRHELSDRYLTHLAQARVVGEKNYANYMKNTGLVTMWFTEGYETAKSACERTVKLINDYAKAINLRMANDLTYL